ncbi:NUDIX hydrolase [Halomarina rubra]|uniref:NUDIX hydrolase n=1 Tax=Halomarina rubra TaxID=2071873 RepID=A0ABD6AW86_9EURY|nr:NUDIX domain-containing protein [Halomarina rubra]
MAHINRETVERRHERLLEEYGTDGVELVEKRWESPPEEFEEFADLSRAGYVGGGYCWVTRTAEQFAALTESMPESAAPDPDEERALMILNRDLHSWGVAGGGREADETFEEAAVREVREETGVDCEVTDLFRVEHATRRCTAPDDDRVCHMLFVFFDADYAGGEIRVQPGELHGAAWFRDAPSRVDDAAQKRAEEWFDER